MRFSLVSIGEPESPLNPAAKNATGGYCVVDFMRKVCEETGKLGRRFDQLDFLPCPPGSEAALDEALALVKAEGLVDSFSGVCFTGKHWRDKEDVAENTSGLHRQWNQIAKFGNVAAGPIFRGFAHEVGSCPSTTITDLWISDIVDGVSNSILSWDGTGLDYVLAELLNSRENNGFNDPISCLECASQIRKRIAGKTKIKFGSLPDIAHLEDYRLRVCPNRPIQKVLEPYWVEFQECMPPTIHFSMVWTRGRFNLDGPTPIEQWANFLLETGFDGTIAIEIFANHQELRKLIPGFGTWTFDPEQTATIFAEALDIVQRLFGIDN